MTNHILSIILLFLMIYISGKRGIKLFISIVLNYLILILFFYFIALGLNPIIVSLIGAFILSYVVLFFVNGKNVKTKSSIISVVIVLIILTGCIFLISSLTRIAGFGIEASEEINMYSFDINMDYSLISLSLILIGLIGATVDASIAISSAVHEVYLNNKHLSSKELFKSGLNIGRDIIGTSVNTILFAFLGEFMTLLIWFKFGNYSFLEIINSKTFSMEFVKIIFSTLGCLYVIPITSLITSKKETSMI